MAWNRFAMPQSGAVRAPLARAAAPRNVAFRKTSGRGLPGQLGRMSPMQRNVGLLSRLMLGFLCLSLIAAADARAAGYPDRPVRIIVGYPAGLSLIHISEPTRL